MTGIIALEDGEFSVNELDGTIAITITRTGDLSGPVTIEYGVNPDTASEGLDYLDQDGFVSMAAGQAEVTVTLNILDDDLFENTEVFNFSLVNVDSGTLQFPRTARINILDDENPVDDVPVPPLVSDFIVTTETIIDGYDRPIALEFVPGSSELALLATKPGEIVVINTETGVELDTFINLRTQVNVAGDRGLLDIAIHPDFENNSYVYAMYVVDPAETAGQSGNAARDGAGNRFAHVVRYEADMSNGYPELVANSATVIVGAAAQTLSDISGAGAINSTSVENVDLRSSDVDPATGEYIDDYIKVDALSHAGGALEFGPDGALYIGVGDGTSFNFADPRSVAVQDLNSLSGKILRVDPITGAGLSDNPFYETGMDLGSNQARVYQLGLRNPYTMAIDDDGTILVSNTGWFAYEEIESGGPGANFGWPYFEGGDNGTLVRTPDYQYLPTAAAFYEAVENGEIEVTAAFRGFSHADADPGFQIQAIVGASSIFSGDAYGGEFDNYYFFTDVSEGEVYAINVNDRREIEYLYTAETNFGPVHFKQGNDGLLYYVDLITGEVGRYDIERDPNGGGGGEFEPTFVNDIAAEVQFLTGTQGIDTFIIDGAFADYQMAQTQDQNGVVIWNTENYDVLTGFEMIQFSDRSVDATLLLQSGPDYIDDPLNNLQLKGDSAFDRFTIDGASDQFNWGPTEDGLGTVIWNDNGYDVLIGFEAVAFNDREVDLVAEPSSTAGDTGGGGGGAEENLILDVANQTQHPLGSTENDIFVIDGESADYEWGPSESGARVVVWGPTGYDVLESVEAIRFNDRTVDITSVLQDGPDYFDIADQVQHLNATSGTGNFIIDGQSADYDWGLTQSNTGHVVWTSDIIDTSYDVLRGFETITFNDRVVNLELEI